MIQKENYITIQGWMRTELNLKGNDLLVYAIIYGFTQTQSQKFTGSLQYLADWCGSTKQSILRNLKDLVDRGLIERQDNYINGVKMVEYKATPTTVLTKSERHKHNDDDRKHNDNEPLSLCESPVNIMRTNNIEDNIVNISDNNSIGQGTKKQGVENRGLVSLINNFTENEELRESLNDFVQMRKLIKKPLTEKGLTLMLNKLKSLSKDEKIQIAIVNQSIEHNWQSVYPLKELPREESILDGIL